VSSCIQCGESAVILLTRQRPLMRGASTYELCVGCARRIREEQDVRATRADEQAERSGV
jgi:hypothetical protein